MKKYKIDYITEQDIVEIQFNTSELNGDYPFMDTIQYKKEDYDKMTQADIENMIDEKRTEWKNHVLSPNGK